LTRVGGLIIPDWPRALGPTHAHGKIRSKPRDFRVDEIALLEPSGDGAHLWLRLEKQGANTEWVARQLAQKSGCAARDVGYAGMKDRDAVTTQWFSIPCPVTGAMDWARWEIPGVTIITAARHTRKLKRGALGGNRFLILVRQLEGDAAALQSRLSSVAAHGVPNYFGPQRFGHRGLNLERGARLLAGEQTRRRLPRHKRSIYISAVRSFLFNQVLAARVTAGNWNRIVDGETASLDGSRSVFSCTLPDESLARRCQEFDIHPSGPLPGTDGSPPQADALSIEREVLGEYPALVDGLKGAGVAAARRSLRLPVRELNWRVGEGSLELSFSLPPGGYATSVLRELVSTG
jgi:tRNA pseudouridine13 synthase